MYGKEIEADGMMLVFSSFPDMKKAQEIGSGLVADRLAACVNLIPQVESHFLWEGKMQSENEVLAIFKLRSDRFAEFQDAIQDRHPYEVPEVVGITADKANGAYLDWVLGP